MAVNPDHRRSLAALGLARERLQLEVLVGAIVDRAIRTYGAEPIADAWPHVNAAAELYLRQAADLGAFAYFGVRDGGDLIGLPRAVYVAGPPGPVGRIGVDATAIARLIVRGGTRREWVRPRDLAFTAAAR